MKIIDEIETQKIKQWNKQTNKDGKEQKVGGQKL